MPVSCTGIFVLTIKPNVRRTSFVLHDFGYDWVNVMSDPYTEASAYGTQLYYPENNLPQVVQFLIREIDDIDRLKVLKAGEHARMTTICKRDKGIQKAPWRYPVYLWLGGGSACQNIAI